MMRGGQHGLFACIVAITSGSALFACAPKPAPPSPPLREVCAAVPACPSWVDAFSVNPVRLHVHVFDGVSGSPACTGSKTVHVTVFLDDRAVGTTDVPCLELTSPTAAGTPRGFTRSTAGRSFPDCTS